MDNTLASEAGNTSSILVETTITKMRSAFEMVKI